MWRQVLHDPPGLPEGRHIVHALPLSIAPNEGGDHHGEGLFDDTPVHGGNLSVQIT